MRENGTSTDEALFQYGFEDNNFPLSTQHWEVRLFLTLLLVGIAGWATILFIYSCFPGRAFSLALYVGIIIVWIPVSYYAAEVAPYSNEEE